MGDNPHTGAAMTTWHNRAGKQWEDVGEYIAEGREEDEVWYVVGNVDVVVEKAGMRWSCVLHGHDRDDHHPVQIRITDPGIDDTENEYAARIEECVGTDGASEISKLMWLWEPPDQLLLSSLGYIVPSGGT